MDAEPPLPLALEIPTLSRARTRITHTDCGEIQVYVTTLQAVLKSYIYRPSVFG
jgi:hypothetical protein